MKYVGCTKYRSLPYRTQKIRVWGRLEHGRLGVSFRNRIKSSSSQGSQFSKNTLLTRSECHSRTECCAQVSTDGRYTQLLHLTQFDARYRTPNTLVRSPPKSNDFC